MSSISYRKLWLTAITCLLPAGTVVAQNEQISHGLFTRSESYVREFLDESWTIESHEDERIATENDPLGIGEVLQRTTTVERAGFVLNSGRVRTGLAAGLGVESYAQLPIGLLPEEQAPRRSEFHAEASHVRVFVLENPEVDDEADSLLVQVFASGTLQLLRQVEDAMLEPATDLLHAAVELEVGIYQEIEGVRETLALLYENAVLGAEESVASLLVTDGWGSAWLRSTTPDRRQAEVFWSQFVQGKGLPQYGGVIEPKCLPESVFWSDVHVDPMVLSSFVEPCVDVLQGVPFEVVYKIGVKSFTNFNFEGSSAAGWESSARFGSTATMDLVPADSSAVLTELTHRQNLPQPGNLIESFSSSASQVFTGQTVTLSWSAPNASECMTVGGPALWDDTEVGVSGVLDVPITAEFENQFVLECSDGVEVDTRLLSVDATNVRLNSAFNDAWLNDDTQGQGFLLTALPEFGAAFAAWFTFDTEPAGNDATAILGSPDHRWLTAFGPIQGHRSEMAIEVTRNGIFNLQEGEQSADGTLTFTFEDCASGLVEYDIPSIGRQGTIPIRRATPDNVALCESLLGLQP